MPYRLGKLAPKAHPKTLLFNKYRLATSIPPPPNKTFREYKIPANGWGMLGNDVIGDCTCAGPAHQLMLWSAHTGGMITPTLDDVLTAYSSVSGYDKNTGMNDNGAVITDVLNYLLTTGMSGHKIAGWVKIDHTSIDAIKQAIYLFGGVNIGVQMPSSAMDQFDAGEPWDVSHFDDNDGGHCVPLFGYGRYGTTCVTWGRTQPMTWEWFLRYCDEAYGVISADWLNKDLIAPNRLDMAALKTDLAALQAA